MAGDVIFLFVSFLAAIGATLAGFGSSTLLIPVAVSFFDLKMAVFLVACFHLFNNLFKIRIFWNKIDFRTVILFGIPSIIFAFVGARFITVMPLKTVKSILGIFLICYALFTLVKPKFSVRESRANAFLGGSLSGFLAGLIGMGGAIRSSFLVAFNLPKEVYVATSAMVAVVIDLTRIPTYIFTRAVEWSSEFILIPLLVLSAYFGVRVGKLLLNKINQETFRRIVSAALLLVGIKILF
jgi:uncharacterized membrane protein YfcA